MSWVSIEGEARRSRRNRGTPEQKREVVGDAGRRWGERSRVLRSPRRPAGAKIVVDGLDDGQHQTAASGAPSRQRERSATGAKDRSACPQQAGGAQEQAPDLGGTDGASSSLQSTQTPEAVMGLLAVRGAALARCTNSAMADLGELGIARATSATQPHQQAVPAAGPGTAGEAQVAGWRRARGATRSRATSGAPSRRCSKLSRTSRTCLSRRYPASASSGLWPDVSETPRHGRSRMRGAWAPQWRRGG